MAINTQRRLKPDTQLADKRFILIGPEEYIGEPRYSFDMARMPEDQRGSCLVCGCGFFEYLACQSGDCHFVRAIEEGPA